MQTHWPNNKIDAKAFPSTSEMLCICPSGRLLSPVRSRFSSMPLQVANACDCMRSACVCLRMQSAAPSSERQYSTRTQAITWNSHFPLSLRACARSLMPPSLLLLMMMLRSRVLVCLACLYPCVCVLWVCEWSRHSNILVYTSEPASQSAQIAREQGNEEEEEKKRTITQPHM